MKKKYMNKFILLIAFIYLPFSSYSQSYELTSSDVTVVNGVIESCSYSFAITDIVIPNQINGTNITGIGNEVFRDAPITTVVLPPTLVSIGNAAFRKSKLKAIDLSTAGNELVLGGSVFRQCSELTSFTLTANVKEIGQYTFRDASKLEEFIFEDGNTFMTQVTPHDAITRSDATNIPLKKIRFSDNIEIITEELFVFATDLEIVEFASNSKLSIIETGAFPEGKTITLPTPVQSNSTFLHWLKDDQQIAAGTEVSDFSSPYTAIFDNGSSKLTVYVSSSSGDDSNDGLAEASPVKTIKKAKDIIVANNSSLPVEILLKSNDVFDDFEVMTNTTIQDDDDERFRYAFVWDIDRELNFTTYGGSEMAILNGGKYSTPTTQNKPQGGFCVSSPSTKEVVVQNILFQEWQTTAFHVLATENVTFSNNKVEKVGTRYFDPELNSTGNNYIFCAGVFYSRSSKNLKVLNNEFIDMHNAWSKGPNMPTEQDIEALHTFYLTRTMDSEIALNKVSNTSGPPIKIRRQPAKGVSNNIHVHDNEFIKTGPSIQIANLRNFSQRGWFRYSGERFDDNSPNCPEGILIENNKFYYPYCWDEYENCVTAEAELSSVSNTSACGDAVDNINKVIWRNNDIRLIDESLSTPELNNIENTVTIINNGINKGVDIRVNVVSAAKINLEIFDLQGRIITTISKQLISAGQHSFIWQGSAKGVYIIKSSIDGKINTKKFIMQ
jgi:hypothetical protein